MCDVIKLSALACAAIAQCFYCKQNIHLALIYCHRINPEAQRILGNSCIAVVSLERLDFQSVYLSSLQPVVTLVRLPGQTLSDLHNELPLNGPQQVQK